jgi:hypothetical protein
MEKNERKFENIDIGVIEFDAKYIRARGTVSQIVKSLDHMKSKLENPKDDFQKEIYPKMSTLCNQILEKYDNLVQFIYEGDYCEFGHYLNGPSNNGKRKKTTNKNELKTYETSEFLETLRSIDDRLRHIKNNCHKRISISTSSTSSTSYRTYSEVDIEMLKRVIEFCDKYHLFLREKMEDWKQFIKTTREKYPKK